MSAAFGWTTEEVEKHVVALIQSGDIQGRVDSQNKARVISILRCDVLTCLQILKAKKQDHRAELFTRAIKAGSDIQSANRKLLLRMRL